MAATQPRSDFDPRFSDPTAEATSWPEVLRALQQAELYWLTTVRTDGRPHVTPLIGVLDGDAVHFCTGPEEQKARNLEHNPQVAVTTGQNAWAKGLDLVVEGTAKRLTDGATLQRLADAYEAKYGSDWHFDVADGAFVSEGHPATVFRVEPRKVLAFAKRPHAQTAYRFTTS
jgi:PPOX class probable F420-dependent enzyme